MFTLLMLPFSLGIATYFYFFLRRMLTVVGAPIDKRPLKLIIGAIALILGLMSTNLGGVSSAVLLHIFLLAVLMHPINFFLRRLTARRAPRLAELWRKIYNSGAIPLLLSAIILFGGYLNLHHVVATRYTLETDKNIRPQGYRIVMIADMHYGISLDNEQLLAQCKAINAENPDLIVLCGDLVDGDTSKEQMLELYRALATLESRYGTYYVHGNHDLPFALDSYTFTAKELTDAILQSGIHILEDETVQITEDLVLIGRADRSAHLLGRDARADLDSLFARVDREDYVLVLDHQPNEYDQNRQAGSDLILSGHTHGGQLFPINWIQEAIPFNDGVYGLYALGGNTHAIVTSGFATWNYPTKTAAPCEYVVIDLIPRNSP